MSETTQKAHWKSETNSVQDKMQSETKFSSRKYPRISFSDKFFFLIKFFSDKFFSRLNFVSDYIPQLHFVCNLLFLNEVNRLKVHSSNANQHNL